MNYDSERGCNLYTLLILYRSRTPQPPAEDEEENIDDTLVTIDTCKYKDKTHLCRIKVTCEKN